MEALQQQLQAMQQQMHQQQAEREALVRQLQETQQQLQTQQQNAVQQQVDMHQQMQTMQQTMMKAFMDAMTKQTEALSALGRPASQKPTLIDSKGLGRPYTYDGHESKFLPWITKTENYILGVFPDLRLVSEWACEKAGPVRQDDLDTAFGSRADEVVRVDDLDYMNQQLHTVLTQLTEAEPFDIVQSSGKSGLEAWRRLNRRYDPSTGGRKRNLLNSILHPGKAKLHSLSGMLDQWQERVRRYEQRKGESGERLQIPDDIEYGILESMLLDELEKHLMLNRARLNIFDDNLNEVALYVEARTGIRLQSDTVGGANYDPNAMDVGALNKGGKGKGKGKGEGKDGKGKGDGKGWWNYNNNQS